MTIREELAQLNREAEKLPDDEIKIKKYEKIIELADLLNDDFEQFEARWEYSYTIYKAEGFEERLISVLPWMLNYYDRYDEMRPRVLSLIIFKSALQSLPSFTHVNLKNIEAAFEDLLNRFERGGMDIESCFYVYRYVNMVIGNREGAIAAHSKLNLDFSNIEIDAVKLNSCHVCQTNALAEYYLFLGDFPEALKTAQPILRGEISCGDVPRFTCSSFLFPLLQNRKFEEAINAFNRLQNFLKKEDSNSLSIGKNLLTYYSISGNEAAANKNMNKYFPIAFSTLNKLSKLYYYNTMLFHLQSLNAKRKSKTIKLTLPKEFELYNSNNLYSKIQLQEWLVKEVNLLKIAFDTRNENTYVSEKIEGLHSLREIQDEYRAFLKTYKASDSI